MEKHQWQPEQILANKYRIKKVLPKGFLGSSYEVEHFEWDMPLRLKCLSYQCFEKQNQGEQLKYAMERWIALPGYPNIVHCFHWETIECELCLVTEYIEADNLEEILPKIKRFDECLDIAIQMGYGLQCLRQNRMAHGNLKPQNILIPPYRTAILDDICGVALHVEPEDSNKKATQYEVGRPEALFTQDMKDFIKIIRYLCLKMDHAQNDFHFEHTPQSIPASSENRIPSELKRWLDDMESQNGLYDLDSAVLSLKTIYEKITGGSYKKSEILPARLYVNNLHKHAFCFLEQGALLAAERIWNLASESTPSSLHALWNWHLFNLRRGQMTLDSVLGFLENMKEMDEYHLISVQIKLCMEFGCKIYQTMERLQQVPQQLTSNPEILRLQGELYYRVMDFDKAVENFSQLVRSKSHEPEDWYRLAISHFSIKDFKSCQEACIKGLEEHNGHVLFQLVQNVLWYLQGNIEQCAAKFQEMVKQHPNRYLVLLHAAHFYAGRNIYLREVTEDQKKLACSLYEKVLNITPSSIAALQGHHECGGSGMPNPCESARSIVSWSELRQWTEHTETVTTLSITPDGEWIVSGDCEGNLFVCDAHKKRPALKLEGHEKHISATAITSDGTRVVSGSWDRTVRVWDAVSGQQLWLLKDHEDKISSLSITPDAKYLISGSWDATARVWDLASGQCISCLKTEGLWVTDVIILDSGNMAITCDQEEQMILWELPSGKILARMSGISMLLHPNKNIVVSTDAHCLNFWEIPTGKNISSMPMQDRELLINMSKDGGILLTRNEDDVMTLWDLWNKRKIMVLHNEESMCSDMTEDGQYIVSGFENKVCLWRDMAQNLFPLLRKARYLPSFVRDGLKKPEMIEENLRKAEIATVNKDYKTAIGLYNSIQRIPGYEHTNLVCSRVAQVAFQEHIGRKGVKNIHFIRQVLLPEEATSMALAFEGEIALIASDDDPIQVWNMKSGYRSHFLDGHCDCVSSLAISKQGHFAVSTHWDGTAILWSMDSPSLYSMQTLSKTWITSAAISPAGDYVLYGDRKGRLFLQDIGHSITYTLQEESSFGTACHTILPSSTHAVVAFENGSVCIWDIAERKIVSQHRPHGRFITAIDASSNAEKIISTSRNGSILLWESGSGKVLQELKHEGENIRKLKMLDDMAISVSKNGILRVWSFEESNCVADHYLHDTEIMSASISHDGRFLISGDELKSMAFWEIEWGWKI